MSFQPSRPETIRTLFHGNSFVIPDYQRKYSWQFDQRKALWDDIAENLSMKHFIGTLCFKKVEDSPGIFLEVYEIIDGQQRVTTLFLMLNVLIEKIEDVELKKGYVDLFVGSRSNSKLDALGVDEAFLKDVIFDFDKIVEKDLRIRSQINLYQAKKDFISFSSKFNQQNIKDWLVFITTKIEILIFNVNKQAEAVKMFSVINDRGLPLSNLDKTKSILMLYSTLYLGEALNHDINIKFGCIFDFFDQMVFQKNELGLFQTLDDLEFENTFYTHHYYSASKLFPDWDYQLGADSVFKHVKRVCESYKSDPARLTTYINDYISDLYKFAEAYAGLLVHIETSKEYQQYFLYMQFTATLYPLIVRLYEQKKLDALLPILETTEMRVYKLKNTNPRRNMYLLASAITNNDMEIGTIDKELRTFSNNFCNDFLAEPYLLDQVDRKTAFVRYLLYKYNQKIYKQSLSLSDFRNIQVEHIFSVSPNFTIRQYGFHKHELYNLDITKMGNLTILEKSINKDVNNVAPIDKLEGYTKSKIKINLQIVGEIKNFNKQEIENRTQVLINFFLEEFFLFQNNA